jgi:hypothetical protein
MIVVFGVYAMKTTEFIYGLIILLLYATIPAMACDFYSPWAYNGCYSLETVPYFALHPPVYYSRPIARTYGDSPFPYPPGLTALQSSSPILQPLVVKNVYCEESADQDMQQSQTHVPLRIRNPFVNQTDDAAMSKGVKWETIKSPKPQVIYPASLARQSR